MTHLHAALLLFAPAQGGGSLLPFLIQIAAIFAIFYFILIRPQQKQRQQHEEALRSLKKGDEVVTSGGIVGTVVHIREMTTETPAAGGGAAGATTGRSMSDHVTIRSAESRLVVERGRIARIVRGDVTTEAPR